MARPPRIQFDGASYHVFNRGNRRERIFRSDADYRAFETYMLQSMKRTGVQLFNWNQLPNHFHFNIATPAGNLAEFMQRLLARYAKYFNVTYRLVGHLFQSRYGAKLVDRDVYFKEIIRYVELNAYRVKRRPLAELGRWRWSSLHYLLQPESAWPEGCQNAFRHVLDTFSDNPTRAREQLLKFLADGLKSGTWKDFYQPKEGRFLGDDDFVKRLKADHETPASQVPNLDERLTLAGLLQAIEGSSGLSLERLGAVGKDRRSSRWRQVMVGMARKLRIPNVQVARLLNRSESAVSMMDARSALERDHWPETRQLLDALSKQL